MHAMPYLEVIGIIPHHSTKLYLTTNHGQAYNRHPWVSTNQERPITGQERKTHYPRMQV